MAKTAFDKIASGLDDAIAYSKGDRSRGKPRKAPLAPDPTAQRNALRSWFNRFGDAASFAAEFSVSPRAVQRFYSGQQALPPGLCREVATHCQTHGEAILASEFRHLEGSEK